jgi:hypothetical protein
MSYAKLDAQSLSSDLYVVTRESAEKPWVDHFALLDIGNWLQIPDPGGVYPTIVHQAPPQLQCDWFANTGEWRLIGRVVDKEGAVARFWEAARERPGYDGLANNCEHLLWYVVTGRSQSPQVRRGLWSLGLAIAAVWAWNRRRGE